MESSIAVFLLRQPACERLPTMPHRMQTKPTGCGQTTAPNNPNGTRHTNARRYPNVRDMRARKQRSTRCCSRRQAANNTRTHHNVNDHHRT